MLARRPGSRWSPTRWTTSRQTSAAKPWNASCWPCQACSCGLLSLTCAATPGSRPRSERLAGYDALWVRGGNVFVLRHALRRSGGGTVVTGALRRDALAYAGYSAGPCVLASSLRGLDAVDDANAVTRIHGASPIFDGLGVLPLCDRAALPVSRSSRKRGLRSGRLPVRRRRHSPPDASRRAGPGHQRRRRRRAGRPPAGAVPVCAACRRRAGRHCPVLQSRFHRM